MREILPGVHHWTATHPKIGVRVSSYWLDEQGVLIDPLIPPGVGVEWFGRRPVKPRAILLSNRHHYRHSGELAQAFGCEVYCNEKGLHEFTHGERVRGFAVGDDLPGGVRACEMDAICPDDTALYIPAKRALALADGVVRGGPHEQPGDEPDAVPGDEPDAVRGDEPDAVRGDEPDASPGEGGGDGGPLGFVPGRLMDDPPATRRGLLDACSRLLAELDFDHLLLAHGAPLIGDGRAQLQELVDSGGRTAFEM